MNPADRTRAGEHAATLRALVDLTRAPSGVTPPLGIPLGRLRSESTPLPDHRLASFVRAAIEVYKDLPGLVDMQVCLVPHSRSHHSETRWVTLADWLDDAQRASVVERALTSGEETPFPVGEDAAWVLARPIHQRGTASLGYLIALFENAQTALEADGAIEGLVQNLALGLGLRRQALATEAATELSSALAEAATHQEALRWMTDILCTSTRSDGAKVHVLRRTPTGPRVELLYRTDRPDSPRMRHGLSRKTGFVDWVFVQNDWLLFPSESAAASPLPGVRREGTGMTEPARECSRALTGRHGLVTVIPRDGDDSDLATKKDERPMLIVPLRVRGQVLGVLSLWRTTEDPYDSDMDRPLVEMLARHVASACRWLMHSEAMQRAVAEVSELGRVAAAGETSHSVYRAVANGVGRLAQAARAVLLLQDGSRENSYYGVALWSGIDDEGSLDALAARYVAHAPAKTDSLLAELSESLRGAHVPGREGVRFVLRTVLPMGPATDASGSPGGLIALFDQEFPERERRPTADDGLGREAAATFLEQVAPIAWGSYPQAFAQKVARELSDPTASSSLESPEHVLARAAELLVNRTGADAVLVYRSEHGKMVVASAAPEQSDLLGMAAGSHTLEAFHTGHLRSVRDTEDHRDPFHHRIDQKTLGRIAHAYGWNGVRSWLCYPLIEGGRTLGLLKLLTRRGGAFLDPCATVVVEAVAMRAAAEIRRMNRALMLAGLNQLALDLGGKERHELTQTMGAGVERWARRFIHPTCHVVVIASVRSPQPRLFAWCAHLEPDRFDTDNAEHLLSLFDAGRKKQRVEHAEIEPPWVLHGHKMTGAHQMITPIDAPGNLSLLAWLLITADEPFLAEDLAAAREAAREMSIFLDYEHRRQIWAHQVARFRHAVIGPMQGLTSAARMLARFASDHVGEAEKERVRTLALRVEEEAESTRLWRENQRIYMAEEVEIVPKRQALRPIVDKCIKRFTEMLQARGIGLVFVWKPLGSIDFAFDGAALDLVLTNIIDNARKYAFFNRDIEVGVEVDGAIVRVWVEDVGHAIPDRLARSVYRVGERLDWKDPIRAIDGTGLGLPMARALVEAHGGTIRHSSQPIGMPKDGAGDLQPHRVRFVVELPHQWRQR